MKIIVAGADGFLGWAASLFFSAKDWEVLGIDNYCKRQNAQSVNEESLIPIKSFVSRAEYWNSLKKGKPIQTEVGDITDYRFLKRVFRDFQPDVIIDLAELPSAPFSVIDYDKAKKTLINNVLGTLTIAHVVHEVCPNCIIQKFDTMGVYGTPNTDIPEGFFEFEYNGKKDKRLFPREGGSLYHTSKINDIDILWYYCRVWGLAVQSVCQGPVNFIPTEEMRNDTNLLTSFYYQEVWGTVYNRFVTQSIVGYPLTVYGKGNQTRGYLTLSDAVACMYLLANNPPKKGEMKVINQITQIFTVNQLAEMVKRVGDKLGYPTAIQHIENPRMEKEEHYYNPKYTTLLELGLKPTYLTDEVIESTFKAIEPYKDRIDKSVIFKGYKWSCLNV